MYQRNICLVGNACKKMFLQGILMKIALLDMKFIVSELPLQTILLGCIRHMQSAESCDAFDYLVQQLILRKVTLREAYQ